MRKKLPLYAAVVFIIFVPLLLVFSFGGYGQELAGHELPIAFGLSVFTLLLFDIILSTRSKLLESKMGLQNLYAVHGAAAIMVVLAGLAHIVMEVAKVKIGNFAIPAAPLGILGFLCLAIAILMGVLYLSVNFIGKSPKLMRRKDGPRKRERALWLHRLSLFAVVLIFGHVVSMPAVRENPLFVALLSFYVVAILLYYSYAKIKSYRPTHVLENIELVTPNVHKMTFAPLANKSLNCQAGQYVFVRFVRSALPKESHPFSIASAPQTMQLSFSLMAKESGDYTKKLPLLKQGDIASIEGPYGNFWSAPVAAKNSPIVLMAGGIGITPHLSILNEQLATDRSRLIYLIWGAAALQDTFDLDIFQKMEEDNPGFKFHLILANENRPPYAHGLIDTAYLSEIGVEPLYTKADFLVCGPPGMMNAINSILLGNGVEASRIHLERFDF